MNRRNPKERMPCAVITALLVASVSLVLFLPGCAGGATPEEAVREFLVSVDTNNWNLFRESILPDLVRRMKQEDIDYWRDRALAHARESVKFNPKQLKLSSKPEGKDAATVKVVEGRITLVKRKDNTDVYLDMKTEVSSYIDPKTKKLVSNKFTDEERQIAESLGVYKVKKYKGRWYVEFPLAHSEE